MAITFVAATAPAAANSSAGGTTANPGYPTGVLDGDLVVVYVLQRVASSVTFPTPTGWTLRGTAAANSDGATLNVTGDTGAA